MAIMLGGKIYKYEDDELWINGKRLKEAHVNGKLVYPERMRYEAIFTAARASENFEKERVFRDPYGTEIDFYESTIPVSSSVVWAVGSEEPFTVNSNGLIEKVKERGYQDFVIKCTYSFSAPFGLSVPAALVQTFGDAVIESGEASTTTGAGFSLAIKFKIRALAKSEYTYFFPVSIDPEPLNDSGSWLYVFSTSGEQVPTYDATTLDNRIEIIFASIENHGTSLRPSDISFRFIPNWFLSLDKYSGSFTYDETEKHYDYNGYKWGRSSGDAVRIGSQYEYEDFSLTEWRG